MIAAATQGDGIAWYENTDGRGSFERREVFDEDPFRPKSIAAVDLDGDGDQDLITPYRFFEVVWRENVDGRGTFAAPRKLTTATDQSFENRFVPADVDGDGDWDLVVVAKTAYERQIAWLENRGGQSGLVTTDSPPSTPSDPSLVDVLRVEAFHRGRTGDSDQELARLSLRLERPTGEVLSSGELNGLIDAILVYRDDGNDRFDAADALVASDDELTLADGITQVLLPDGDPRVRIGVGAPATFFVVVRTGPSAATHPVDAFRVTHVTNGLRGSVIENRLTDASMSIESVDDFSSALITFSPTTVLSIARDEPEPLFGRTSTRFVVSFSDEVTGVDATDFRIAGNGVGGIVGAVDGRGSQYTITVNGLVGRGTLRLELVDDNSIRDTRGIPLGGYRRGDGNAQSPAYDVATIHRSALFTSQRVVRSRLNGASTAVPVDFDRDGDLDVLATARFTGRVAWYENSDGRGTFTTEHVIADVVGQPISVAVADIDGDADPDILYGALNTSELAWHENLDGVGTFGPPRTISELSYATLAVYAADLDGDGDQDVLGASLSNQVAWYENLDGQGTFGPRHIIVVGEDRVASVFAADLDGDGDLDVLSAAELGDRVAWYENRDGKGDFGRPQVITTETPGARSVVAADVDGDGDLDVLSASSTFASVRQQDDRIAWYENVDGRGTFGPQRIISTDVFRPYAVLAVDLDADGDQDVLSTSRTGDAVSWYENTDGRGTFGPQRIVRGNVDGPRTVAVGDLDGDGDLDVLASLELANAVAWFENQGGQVAFDTADTAPATIGDGEADDVLRIVVRHLGRPGDHTEQLASVSLVLEQSPGRPLDRATAESLMSRVELYRDQGNGTFDLADTFVTTVDRFDLTDGMLTIPLRAGDPRVQIAARESATFFVVPRLTMNASDQAVNQFRIAHVVSGPGASRVEDTAARTPVLLEFAPDVSSSIVGAAQDVTAPSVDIIDIQPDPRLGSVDEATIVFSEAVVGFDLSDLTLVCGGAAVSLRGQAELTTDDRIRWKLTGLTALTDRPGTYVLGLSAPNSGIADPRGHELPRNVVDSWTDVRQPGDANLDGRFDQRDVVALLQAGHYLSGLRAAWRDGDFNGDGLFDQLDVVSALATENYLQAPYAVLDAALAELFTPGF